MVPASVLASEGAGWPEALPLLPHPAEMITGLVAFAILYWIYAKKVVPRMEELYAQRAAAIEGGMKEAEEAQAQAQAALEQYTAQLAEARHEANTIRETAREEGAAHIADARAQATAEASRITEAASRAVEAERAQAVVSLRQEVGALSTTLAGKIVGESLDDKRSASIVDRFIKDLDSGAVKAQKVSSGQGA